MFKKNPKGLLANEDQQQGDKRKVKYKDIQLMSK